MNEMDSLFAYAAEVLAFDFKDAPAVRIPPTPDAARRMAERCAGAFARSGKTRLTLLGLGSGAVAEALAAMLPPDTLLVCEQNLGLARALLAAGRLRWCQPGPDNAPPRARLALDASPWALLLLLDRAGLPFGAGGEIMTLPTPELPPAEKAKLRPLELLLTRSDPVALSRHAPMPRLSVAAILSPTEPGLEIFFAQLPPWLFELVLVWDADVIPDIPVPRRFPVWQGARRLNRDFSAQRNFMLSACQGDFVLYLDADEGFSPEDWAALPGLCGVPGVDGWLLPRVTLYPTPDRVLTGFGLWPDPQLRLFRRTPDLRFVNPVHERLAGLDGRRGLALDVEIMHLSRLRKSEAELRRKLLGFDAAGAGAVRHALSSEYPSVPRALVGRRDPSRSAAPRGLLLPQELG
ncbi:MAG: hypothetical protein AUJ49_05850 [Desulfovibrionaceae bacterium CG1_02_65_16]|nr:MAG: hypothetical protein AUJ49_05850 [Desulfovibrionaceae bacterium CG1_02_65_16]